MLAVGDYVKVCSITERPLVTCPNCGFDSSEAGEQGSLTKGVGRTGKITEIAATIQGVFCQRCNRDIPVPLHFRQMNVLVMFTQPFGNVLGRAIGGLWAFPEELEVVRGLGLGLPPTPPTPSPHEETPPPRPRTTDWVPQWEPRPLTTDLTERPLGRDSEAGQALAGYYAASAHVTIKVYSGDSATALEELRAIAEIRAESTARRPTQAAVLLTCTGCGSEFYRRPSYAPRTSWPFCSPACYRASRQQRAEERRRAKPAAERKTLGRPLGAKNKIKQATQGQGG